MTTLPPADSAGTRHTITVAEGVQFQVVVPAGDDGDVSQDFARGAHPYTSAADVLLELLTPGATVLDLGAHVGSFSLLAAALGCQSIAVEASPINVRWLLLNLTRNGFERRVRVVSAAVGDQPGTVEFVPSREYGMVANPLLTPGSIRVDSLSTIEILQVTVDELLRDLDVERVDFVKMDVEGSEVAAVRGMRNVLGRPDAPPIFYESNGHTLRHFGATPNQLLGALEELGYSSYRLEQGRLIPVQPTDLQPETCVDYLALKRLPDHLRDERVGGPWTIEETVARIVSESRQSHEHNRAYLARSLASAPDAVRSDPQVRAALDRLRADVHPDVRAAAAWHVPRPRPASYVYNDSRYPGPVRRASDLAGFRADWDGPSIVSAPGEYVAERLGYTRLCNLEDFEHPEIRNLIRTIFDFEITPESPEFPRWREHRKEWEIAMAVRALDGLGALHDRAEILGVGAGTEGTIFWLTNKVARVYATDLYLAPGVWAPEAASSMLTDPGRHWPGRWDPGRLVVQHMNALDLQYEDDAFDGIFSSSSIEHFGTLDDVRRAAEEMCRVLKPGGVLSLSTEFRLDGGPPYEPGMIVFDAAMIREYIIGDLPWALVSPDALTLSPATLTTEQPFEQPLKYPRAHPNIVLSWFGRRYTSVHLAIRKEIA